jgi:anti-sigma regulatory factor (Ser/Thr protein kinase)
MWPHSKQSTQLAIANAQLESVVLQRTAELQTLSQRLLKVQDEERRKLSRDLHDSTGQTLAALKMAVACLHEECKQYPSANLLASEVTGMADLAIEEIRTMSYLLHPPLLDEVGFACAAEWYVEGFAKRTGLEVKLDLATSRERLPGGIEIALFRVLQEGLTNVHRHSGASEVMVSFQYQLRTIVLEIRDNGRGIPAERLDRLRKTSAETGVGLAGMRERMHELNGKVEMESDGHGTTMRAMVPLSAITAGQLGDCSQMTVPSISSDMQRVPDCAICNNPVLLETTKTDENGQAVHEECYVHKVLGAADLHSDAITQRSGAGIPANWEWLRPKWPNPFVTALMQRAKLHPWNKQAWIVDLAATAVILLLACWIAYSDRHAAAGSFESGTTAIAEHLSLPLAKTMLAEYKPTVQTLLVPAEELWNANPLRRGSFETQEVVHIGDDVTVRYFTAKLPTHRVPAGYDRVVYMGADVTVRYFPPASPSTRN